VELKSLDDRDQSCQPELSESSDRLSLCDRASPLNSTTKKNKRRNRMEKNKRRVLRGGVHREWSVVACCKRGFQEGSGTAAPRIIRRPPRTSVRGAAGQPRSGD